MLQAPTVPAFFCRHFAKGERDVERIRIAELSQHFSEVAIDLGIALFNEDRDVQSSWGVRLAKVRFMVASWTRGFFQIYAGQRRHKCQAREKF